MVVDREGAHRDRIAEILADDKIEVACVGDTQSALDLHRKDPFALVITEMNLGTESGLDLLERLRSIDPGGQTMVMTDDVSVDAARAAMRAGAGDLLAKPLDDAEAVRATVRHCLARSAGAGEKRSLVTRIRRDAAELERLNRQLLSLVARDSLTGLYNYRHFRQALEAELSRSRRHSHTLSLALLDVDHFKLYNDAHGQIAGDELLRTLAQMLLVQCRISSTAARYGGEKFIVLVPETSADGAFRFAEDFRAAVETHRFAGCETLPLGKVTISGGVVAYPQSGREPLELIRKLDETLARAKQSGRNVVSVCEAPRPGSAIG